LGSMALTVSVITPSLNQGGYIDRTVRSVLAQDIPNLEYLIVDGGSTDETLATLRRYGDRLRWISEEDSGQAHAINKGIVLTSGEVIGWLNSDDVYYPGAIKAASSFLEEHPDIDIVYGDAEYINEDDAVTGRYPTEPWNLDRLLLECYICQPSVFLRRRVIEFHGMLDDRLQYCMDYEYWIRLGMRGATFAYLPRLQAASRAHPNAKTIKSSLDMQREINEMLREKVGRTTDQWIIYYAHALVERHGFSRSRRVRFAVVVSLVTWCAALRWNRRMSSGLLRTTARWIGGNARETLREALGRWRDVSGKRLGGRCL
jgi:glycosyltransferase involved in cell wall biosynthesis